MKSALTLRRTASEVKRHRIVSRFTWAIVCALAVLMTISYVVSTLYSRYGSFTVSVIRFDRLKYSLSLAETPDFAAATSRLNCSGIEDITNISKDLIPPDVGNINGKHNGNNYIAYTFYCKNSGQSPIDYAYELYIANMTNGIERAARVRLYVNGEYTDYAHTATDGSGAEPDTTAFLTSTVITRKTIAGFLPGEMTKFTVVIWLEGTDPDCVDSVIGGVFKVDMVLSILNIDDEFGT